MDAPLYIVGAGGIGCVIGHALAAARPTLVDANPDKVRWGQAHGVAVDHRPPLPASCIHFDDWRPEPGATVVLCTKCYDNPAVLARLPSAVTLIPIQNGFDPALAAKAAAPLAKSLLKGCLVIAVYAAALFVLGLASGAPWPM